MGLINPDTWTTYQGVQKQGTYVSFADEMIHITKSSVDASGNTVFTVNGRYRIFWDQATRLAGRPAIDMGNASVQVTDLTQNVYGALYAHIKLTMPNATNELI